MRGGKQRAVLVPTAANQAKRILRGHGKGSGFVWMRCGVRVAGAASEDE